MQSMYPTAQADRERVRESEWVYVCEQVQTKQDNILINRKQWQLQFANDWFTP